MNNKIIQNDIKKMLETTKQNWSSDTGFYYITWRIQWSHCVNFLLSYYLFSQCYSLNFYTESLLLFWICLDFNSTMLLWPWVSKKVHPSVNPCIWRKSNLCMSLLSETNLKQPGQAQDETKYSHQKAWNADILDVIFANRCTVYTKVKKKLY